MDGVTVESEVGLCPICKDSLSSVAKFLKVPADGAGRSFLSGLDLERERVSGGVLANHVRF